MAEQTVGRESDGGPLPEFPLLPGGPFHTLMCRARLSSENLARAGLRGAVLALIAWTPMLGLALAAGQAWGPMSASPFLLDVGTLVRFLIALPLLVIAEPIVHTRLRPVAREFLDRGLIRPASQPAFLDAVRSALRWRSSAVAELTILVVAVAGSYLQLRHAVGTIGLPPWAIDPRAGALGVTPAGWWLAFVALPILRFLLLRWYFRVFIWGRFLWRVSKLDLSLVPSHPDRAGGLGFLAEAVEGFRPFLFAHGALMAGSILYRVLTVGAKVTDFKVEVVVLILWLLLAMIGPLLVFMPVMRRARRIGLLEYGGLAQRYVREFDNKWLRGGAPAEEALVGSSDIQSLADMGGSYDVLVGMRTTPIDMKTVISLAVSSLAPLAPLVLTVLSPQELAERLVKLVF